ncbi:hypothetical protein FO519_000663 [Halicephalobus sp. NKZ332]|nr:hypothetical protein FO519_000663 [Halicephalobus sp. NKZ332]
MSYGPTNIAPTNSIQLSLNQTLDWTKSYHNDSTINPREVNRITTNTSKQQQQLVVTQNFDDNCPNKMDQQPSRQYPATVSAFPASDLSFTELLPRTSTFRSVGTHPSSPLISLDSNLSKTGTVDLLHDNYIPNCAVGSVSVDNYSSQPSYNASGTAFISFNRFSNENDKNSDEINRYGSQSELKAPNNPMGTPTTNLKQDTVRDGKLISSSNAVENQKHQSVETQITKLQETDRESMESEIQNTKTQGIQKEKTYPSDKNLSRCSRVEGYEDLVVTRIPESRVSRTDNIIIDAAWSETFRQETKEADSVPETPVVNEHQVTLEDFLKESMEVASSSTMTGLNLRSSTSPDNSLLNDSNSPTAQSTSSDLHIPLVVDTEKDNEQYIHYDTNSQTIGNVDIQMEETPEDMIDEVHSGTERLSRKRKMNKLEFEHSSKKSNEFERGSSKSTEIDGSETDLITAFSNTITEAAVISCLQTVVVNDGLTCLRDIILRSVCKNIAQYFLRRNTVSCFYEAMFKRAQSLAVTRYAKHLLRKRIILPKTRIPRDILHLHQINHFEKLINAIRMKSMNRHCESFSTGKKWINLEPDDVILYAEQVASEYRRRTRRKVPGMEIAAIFLLCPSRIPIYRYYIKDKKSRGNVFFKCLDFIRNIAELGGLAACLFARDQFILEKIIPSFPEQLEASARDFGRLSTEKRESFINVVKSLCDNFRNEAIDEEEKSCITLLISSLSLNFKVFGTLVASGKQNRDRILPAAVNALILERTSESRIPNIGAWVKLFFQTSFGIRIVSFVRRQPPEEQLPMYEKIVTTFVALISQLPKFLKKDGFEDPLKVFREFGEAELGLFQVEDESLCKILNSVMDVAGRYFNFGDSFKEVIINDKIKEVSEETKLRQDQEIYTVEMIKKYSNVKLPTNSMELDLATLVDASFNHSIPEPMRIIKFPSIGELTPTGELILNDVLETFWNFMKIDLDKSILFKFFLQCPLLSTNSYDDFILNGSLAGEPIQAMVNLMQMISFPNYDFKREYIQNRKNIFFGSLISSFRVCYGGQLEEGQITPYIQALADGFRILYRMQDIRLQKCPEAMVMYGCLLSFVYECGEIDMAVLGKELISTIRCHRIDPNSTVDFMVIVQKFLQRFHKEVKEYYSIMSKETNPFQLPNVLSRGQIGWQMLQCIAVEKAVYKVPKKNLIWLLYNTAQERENLMDLVVKVVKQADPPKSCGAEAIPYKIIVDVDGKPEIYCDVPVCFGSQEEAQPESDFDDPDNVRSRRNRRNADKYAECSDNYTERICEENNEWTSGVAEYNNGTHVSLYAQCCKYDGLNYATSMGTIPLLPGNNYTGGTVVENGQPVAFDLIKEVKKRVTSGNEVIYVITVYRMSCIPDPPEKRNNVSPIVEDRVQYFAGRYSDGMRRSRYSEGPAEEDLSYMYPRGYLQERRHRPYYRSSIRRQEGSYYPRRRQYYRPIYDDYEYYEFEPYPAFRRPHYRRFRTRLGEDPWLYYGRKGRPKTYGETPAYGGNTELLEEYTEHTSQPASSYHDTEPKNPLPAAYTDAYNSGPQSPIPLPEASQSPIVQPLTNLGTETSINNYAQPLPQLPNAGYSPPGCAANPCSAVNQNSASQSSYDPSAYNRAYGSGPDLNNMFSTLQCFSGDMLVQTPGGNKRMDELEVGDLVLSIDQNLISYSPVVMFLHNKPEEEAIYKQIETVDGQFIKLTDFHLIYVNNCKNKENLKLIHAKDVKVGQCIHTVLEENRSVLHSNKVHKIIEKKEKGIYAPLTISGDLMVNNVLASCHSNMAVQTLQHTFFSFYRRINEYVESVKFMFGISSSEGTGELPFGVEYMTTVMDVLLPKSLFS